MEQVLPVIDVCVAVEDAVDEFVDVAFADTVCLNLRINMQPLCERAFFKTMNFTSKPVILWVTHHAQGLGLV